MKEQVGKGCRGVGVRNDFDKAGRCEEGRERKKEEVPFLRSVIMYYFSRPDTEFVGHGPMFAASRLSRTLFVHV